MPINILTNINKKTEVVILSLLFRIRNKINQ